jgi:hypothetical protein
VLEIVRPGDGRSESAEKQENTGIGPASACCGESAFTQKRAAGMRECVLLMMSSERAASAVAVIVPSPTRTRACPSSGTLRLGRSRMNPTSAAGEGGSMLARAMMGEGYVAATPHPFESLGRPLRPLPQGERARKARSSPRGAPRDARVAGTPLRGPIITAGDYGSRLSARFRGRRPGRHRLVRVKYQPTAVRKDRWGNFIVLGLLFTMKAATQTCRAAEGDVSPHMSPTMCHHPSSLMCFGFEAPMPSLSIRSNPPPGPRPR